MAAAIELDHLSVNFPSRGKTPGVAALQQVSLSVEAGCVYGFLGPNGAGKTTAMHVLLGFMPATSGAARLFGVDVRQSIARQRIGYLSEHPEIYPYLTGRELLLLMGRLFSLQGSALRDRTAELIELVRLTPAADRRLGTYSRGMLQRIGLAQALINDPDLVLLDEPTSGLDPLGRREMRALIGRLRDQGKTVFFSSHELSEVERVCDRLAILAGGRVVAEGAADRLARAGESLEQVFLRVVAAGPEAGP